MTRRHPLGLVLPILTALLALSPARPAAAADEGYEIKLERPAKVGDKFHLDALCATRNKSTVKVEGEQPKETDESVGVRLEGDVEVKAVTDKGRETKLACTVESCALTKGRESQDLIAKGSVLTAEWRDGRARYQLDGKDLPESAGDLFRRVLELADPDGVGDDEIFGTKDRQKVGVSWPVNPEAAVRDFKQKDMDLNKEDVSGSTRLLEVTKQDDMPCYKLEVTFEGKNVRGKGKGGAEGMTLEKGNIRGTVTALLPTDNKTGPLKETGGVTVRSTFSGKSPDGKPMTVETTMEELAEKTYTRK